jgi:hypothetical protein
MTKKGQAAFEFLTTYGWALVIILVMIAALASFGVIDPEMFLPEKCSVGPGFYCKDFTANTTEVRIVLQNALGKTITVQKATADCPLGHTCTCADDTEEGCGLAWKYGTTTVDQYWRTEESRELIFTVSNIATGTKSKYSFEIQYQGANEYFPKNVTGDVFVKPT